MTNPEEWPLDDEQREAVVSDEAAIAVLAGPGSGKTRTLSFRTRYLLENESDSGALLLTFTNKAAAEMKARSLSAGGLATSRIQASTFHSFGARMLRNHGALVGIDPEFDFLDEELQRDLAGEVATEHRVRNELSRWSYLRLRREVADGECAAFGEHFEQAKRALGAVDYDDLVVYTSDLLASNPDLLAAYADRYRHILIDEFQDTNAAQFASVSALSANAKSVSVFADDDQAIFRFAGAELRNVASFVESLEARTYPLRTNYRSASSIVESANALITCDEDASGRKMRAVRDGGEIKVVRFRDGDAEASALAEEIEERIDAGMPAKDIAVLVRSGYRAREMMDVLTRRGLPVSDWRGAAYEPAGRRLLARCLSIVRGKLNDRQANDIADFCGVDCPEARDSIGFLQDLDSPAAASLRGAFDAAHAGGPSLEVAEAVLRAIHDVDEDSAEEVAPIVAAIGDFEAHDPEFALDDLLAELSLGSMGRAPTTGSGIKVASLHKTKGLQWPVVYMLGMEEGHLPDYREDENPLREERRLCFVGVCRAEDVLILSRIQTFGRHRRIPSRFIAELGQTP